MDISIQSSVGHVRQDNQDFSSCFMNGRQILLAVVCDGMGGHKGGDIASEMAVNHLGHAWENSQLASSSEIMSWLDQHIHLENQRIYQASLRYTDLHGMGTTLVAAVFLNNQVIIAHVGDSRAYLYQADQLIQLTEDDTFVNQLVKSGELSPEEGKNHPKKNILTQSLGVEEELEVKVQSHPFYDGDRLMLATDGFYEGLTEEEMIHFLNQDQALHQVAVQLHDLSLQQSGQDNLTILLAQQAEGEVEN